MPLKLRHVRLCACVRLEGRTMSGECGEGREKENHRWPSNWSADRHREDQWPAPAGSGFFWHTKVPHGPSAGTCESCHSWGAREEEWGAGLRSVLQHGLVALEHALWHLGSSALQGDLEEWRWCQRSKEIQQHISSTTLLTFSHFFKSTLTDKDSGKTSGHKNESLPSEQQLWRWETSKSIESHGGTAAASYALLIKLHQKSNMTIDYGFFQKVITSLNTLFRK